MVLVNLVDRLCSRLYRHPCLRLYRHPCLRPCRHLYLLHLEKEIRDRRLYRLHLEKEIRDYLHFCRHWVMKSHGYLLHIQNLLYLQTQIQILCLYLYPRILYFYRLHLVLVVHDCLHFLVLVVHDLLHLADFH
eukprot:NODE_112_length_18534_cov_1.163656.p17 type:complete len:133 gc:universal NODE_112_length_18534_cov_1.163656:3498-3100(-)